MKTLFTLAKEKQNEQNHTLLMEVGEDYCSYAFLDHEARSFDLVRYIVFDSREGLECLREIIDELKDKSFQRVVFCSAFAQALLIPQKYFTIDYTLLDLVYDVPAQKQLNDAISEWQMVAIYSLPESMHELISSRFSPVYFYHAYTPLLKVHNDVSGVDQISIHFTTQFFRVLVKKDQQVLLAQTYNYKTPLDVVYYLLKICYEFKLDQSEVVLVISGLIDEKSALYEELHNYFLQIQFAQAPDYSVPSNDHPPYYFTSLYNLAACV